MITRKNGKTYIQSENEPLKEVINQWAWLLPWSGDYTPQELAEDIRSAYGMGNPRVKFDVVFLQYYDVSKQKMKDWLHAGRIIQDIYDMYCAVWDYYRINKTRVILNQYSVLED